MSHLDHTSTRIARARSTQLQQKKPRAQVNKQIQIMFGDQPTTGKWALAMWGTELSYMYEPVVSTLIAGFAGMQSRVLPVSTFGASLELCDWPYKTLQSLIWQAQWVGVRACLCDTVR